MDLVGKVAIIVVLLIIVFSAVFVLTRHNAQTKLTPQQAVQFVMSDLKATNPNAAIDVINVSNSTLESGSYNIVLSIVYNATRPCPTLFIEEFDYPATGLVPSLDNLYTKDCVIYGTPNATISTYVISSPEIAIARSYNQSNTQKVRQVTNYVSDFGYNNTVVTATFYSVLNENQTHLGQSFYNVWLVRYKAPAANYSEYAVLDSSDAIAGNYTGT